MVETKPIPDQVLRRLSREMRGRTSVLAVSGGSDSMGLMYLVADLQKGSGSCHVAFVDHGMRPDVDDEWRLVQSHAHSLELRVERLAVKDTIDGSHSGSLQQDARDARYGLLMEHCAEVGADLLLTAHTRDDQAETFLMRAMRGSGLDGLAGIPRRREWGFAEILRPLLDVGRGQIREYLESRGVSWVEDPSNQNPRFSRVRVREEILPLMNEMNPGASQRIASACGEISEIVDFVDGVVRSEKNIVNLRLSGGVKVDSNVLETLPAPLRGRLVRFALENARGDLRGLERSHLEQILSALKERSCTDSLPIPGDVKVYAHRGSLLIFKGDLPTKPTGAGHPTAFGAGAWKVGFAALGAAAELRCDDSSFVEGLEVRSRRKGDRIEGRSKKLKDLLMDAHIPRPYRDFVPVLADGGNVVSCPALLPSRREGLIVRWLLDDAAPFLDIDFPVHTSG